MRVFFIVLSLGVALVAAGCKCDSGPSSLPADEAEVDSPEGAGEADLEEARGGSRTRVEDRRPARVEEPMVEEDEVEEGDGENE